MKQISRGWQNVIYDLGNGRVLKKRSSLLKQYMFIRSEEIRKGEPHSVFRVVTDILRVNRANDRANRYIRKILHRMDTEIIGNPDFLNKSDYEQDKVVVLREILYSSSVDYAKELLDKYVNLIHKTWQYGFSEAMYNFLGNNGINKNGDVIQSDFGELILDKDVVAQKIRNKRWLKTTSFKNFPEGEVKDYHRTIMDKRMTLENLDRIWGKNLHNL